nr:uncharacterized protein LOC106683876 [Halyomorpha halys]
MSNPIFFVLFLSLNSVYVYGLSSNITEVCDNLAEYFNFINKITPITLQFYVKQGSSAVSGCSTLEFSDVDIAVNCTLIDITNNTNLLNVEITSDFIIRTSERRVVKVHDGVIFESMFLARMEDKVKAQTLLIENTGLEEATTEVHGNVESIAEDQIVPYLTSGLSQSLKWNKIIKRRTHFDSMRTTSLFYYVMRYYFSNIALES